MNMTFRSGSSSVARQLDAVHLGHDDVGEQKLERLLAHALIGGLAVVVGRHGIARILQRLHEKAAHVVVVFREQDLGHAPFPSNSVCRPSRIGGDAWAFFAPTGKFEVKAAGGHRPPARARSPAALALGPR
jgi:hypothetical protein